MSLIQLKINLNKDFNSLTLGSAHQKFDVWNKPLCVTRRANLFVSENWKKSENCVWRKVYAYISFMTVLYSFTCFCKGNFAVYDQNLGRVFASSGLRFSYCFGRTVLRPTKKLDKFANATRNFSYQRQIKSILDGNFEIYGNQTSQNVLSLVNYQDYHAWYH